MPETISIGNPRASRAARNAQRIGTHDAHIVCTHVAQALAKSLEAGQGARCHVLVEPAVLPNPGGQPYHLAQPIDDHELPMRVARNHHVEAVRTEIYRSDDLEHCRGGAAHARLGLRWGWREIRR